MKKEKENFKQDIKEGVENEDLKESIENEDLVEEKENKEESVSEEIDEEENEDEKETSGNDEEKLLEEIRALKEEKIRVLAEMENLRKRFDREKIDSIKYGSVNFARDILSPGDNLERALSAINQEEDHSQSIRNLIEGLKMVQKELSSALEKNGITKINTSNQKFDPNLHQAMMEVERNDIEEGIVVQEIQTGYMMHDRLLRPAMVGVSKKPSKDKASNTDNNKKNDDKD